MKTEGESSRRAMPKGVWVLGFVSMLMDVSSEMVHAVLPLFLVATLGASGATVGLIEGIGEATANITKVFSGVISDRLRKRKVLAILGYGFSALTKPLFALAPVPAVVLGARMLDRVGKGVRGAPRDALLADITPPEIRGAAYGLRQALDTIGAVLGPLLAVILLLWQTGNYRLIFWVAIIPGAAAVLLLALGVEDVKEGKEEESAARPKAEGRLPAAFWTVAVLGCLTSLPRLGEGFLILRAASTGIPPYLAPAVPILMNLSYALSSYPAGWLSDRMDRRNMLVAGMAVLALSEGILAVWGSQIGVAAGVLLWGLHLGLTQGVISAMVAETTPKSQKGKAFGVLNFCVGLALLASGFLGGLIWDRMGAPAMYAAGGAVSLLALLATVVLPRARKADS